jgi:hypothetical protein
VAIINPRPFALLLPAIVAAAVAGCASTGTTHAQCFPHLYLDTRYELRGTHGAAGPTEDGDSCYRFIYRDDRLVRVDYRRSGMLTADPALGVASVRVDYPAKDVETRTFLDADRRPVRNISGVYAVQLKYDAARNPVEWRNLDTKGEAMEDRAGLAITRWRHEGNRAVEESHLGANQQLKPDARRGVAVVRWRYDADGNTLEESYFGADGRPTADRLRGVASVRWEYGPHGKTVEESYFGPDGRRTEDKNRGVAMVRWQYDASWNTVEERYFGTDLRSKADRRHGAAIIRWQYDQYGREVGTSMFDPSERPVRSGRN